MTTGADALQTAIGLHRAGELARAEQLYEDFLQTHPDHVETLLNYGRLLEAVGRGQESLELADRAVRLQPDLAAAHVNRGRALVLLAQHRAAVAAFAEALRREAKCIDAYVQLASLYSLHSATDRAIEYCRRGLRLDPTNGSLVNTLGFALREQGRGAEAVECFRKAVSLWPDNAATHGNLLYTLNFLDDYDPPTRYREHLEWARRHAEPLTEKAAPHANDRAPDRRLKIGYVSAFFRESAVNYFVEPILLAHDRRRYEVFCYASFSRALPPDAVTARLQASVDQWRDVRAATDERLAQIVRADEIDILVDLSGHMSQSRLLAFARKPAPVQVTYIGYQNTTGMSAMDYRLTDQRADPPGATDAWYTERLVRLPRSFFCYKPSEAPKVSPLPALQSRRVTFGAFNQLSKMTPRALDAWLEILARVPDSRLLMLAERGGYVERHVAEAAGKKGLDPARVEFHGRRPRLDYLRLVQQADVALDPFPFNGHTTTCDAIWMGVPVVMLEGETYASRFGGCVLAPVGLEHLIARSTDEYVDMAVRMAGDLPGLAQLRRQLRPRMARSVLLDFPGFTRDLEDAYRRMWLEWCGGGHANAGGGTPSAMPPG